MSFILNGAAPIGHPYAPLQITTGGLDVVISGTVITANNKDLQFQLANLNVTFNFLSDGSTPRLGTLTTAGATLNIPLHNFDNPIGTGTTQPLEIGTLQNRKLLLSFMVYTHGPESTKTVHYTFMVGEPA
jgi:hypothetical protein